MDVFAHFPGNYDEEERDDGRVEDPYAAGGDDRGGDGRRGEGGGGGYDDGYTYGRTRDPCEGVDCPPVYWDGTPLPPSLYLHFPARRICCSLQKSDGARNPRRSLQPHGDVHARGGVLSGVPQPTELGGRREARARGETLSTFETYQMGGARELKK